MIKYLTVISLCFLFFFNTGSYANEICRIKNLDVCTDYELCNYATFENVGTVVWRDGEFKPFVDKAKSKGLNCNVSKKVCSEEFKDLCDKDYICEMATFTKHGYLGLGNYWKNIDDPWVKEALNNNLSCETIDKKNEACWKNPSRCSDVDICNHSTFYITSEDIGWDTLKKPNHVKEAKKRGLDCDVNTFSEEDGETLKSSEKDCSDDPTTCNLEDLCLRATSISEDKRYWSKYDNDKNYVKEAKKRGLSCKVGENICGQNYKSSCTDEFVCKRATYETVYGPIWRTSHDKEWADEAQQQGLSCGVTDTAYENFSFTTKLPPCPKDRSRGVLRHNCFGTNVISIDEFGHYEKIYIGEFLNEQMNGFGSYTWDDGNKHIGQFKNGTWEGWALTTWKNGAAIYKKHVNGEGYRSDSNVHSVLSNLKQSFNTLDLDQRKLIQYTLTELGLYNSSIDGKWGRNTLNALAEFAVFSMGTINLNRRDIAQNVIIEVAKVALGEEEEQEQNNNSANIYQNDNTIVNAASGSGFFISEKGHIITNNHVIEGCSRVKTFIDGTEIEAKKIAADRANDLALLKVDQKPAHVFPLSSNNPEILQDVYVAGFPFGEAVSSSIKVTRGIVSAEAGLENNYSEIQIDAAIQPGNSGGPIVDEFGNILGVAVAKLDLEKIIEDYGVIPENVNFGVKVSAVKNLLEGNGINALPSSSEEISKTSLGKNLTKGTVHLSCYMTIAQIKKLQNKKAFFKQFEN